MIKTAFLGVCLLILLLGVFAGFLRRTNRALVRLITLVFCAVGAFLIAKFGVKKLGASAVESLVGQLVENPDLVAYVENNPEFVNLLVSLCTALVAPILFLVCYVVLKAITLIVYKIICWVFRVKKKPHVLGRTGGALIGLACGLIGVLVLVTPVFGYVHMVDHVLGEFPASDENSTLAQVKTVTEIYDTPIASTVYNVLGDKLFSGLTSVKWNDQKIVLMDEIDTAFVVVDNFSVLKQKSMDNYGDAEIEAVSNMTTAIGESPLFSNLGSGLLAGASNAWLRDDTFLGISRPQITGNVGAMLDGFLKVFSTSSADNIDDDLKTFSDMFAVMIKHKLFSAATQTENDFTTQLTAVGVIDEVYATLDANPRMQPVKKAIADIGVRIMMSSMGVPDDLRETHGEMLNDIAGTLKNLADENGNVDATELKNELKNIAGTHEVEVSDSAVQLVADGFAAEFTPEELNTLTEDEIVDRLIERFSSTHE